MNKTKEIYKETIEKLQKIEVLIEEHKKYMGLLMNGAEGISVSLRINKPKTEENYLDKEKEAYTPSPFGLVRIDWFGTTAPKETNTIDTTYQEIPERMAVGICKMLIENLVAERNRLLGILGVTFKNKDMETVLCFYPCPHNRRKFCGTRNEDKTFFVLDE